MRKTAMGILIGGLILGSALGLAGCAEQPEPAGEAETAAEPAHGEDSNVDIQVKADTSGTSVEGEVRIP